MDALEFLKERTRVAADARLREVIVASIPARPEQYPEARIGGDGVLQIYPCSISASHRNARGNCVTMGRKCSDCRREFWMQEVE